MKLEVNDIVVHYGRLAAVRGVSLVVDEGEIVCIVGPNGAGKSTTLLTIAGALTPSSGSVTFDGKAVTGGRPEAIARLGFSMVP
jgi:branched-chain amino acid transport system ATP-binding protein